MFELSDLNMFHAVIGMLCFKMHLFSTVLKMLKIDAWQNNEITDYDDVNDL